MKKPKYTDTHRYTRRYIPAVATDVSKTFARIKRQLSKKGLNQEAQRQSLAHES